MYSLKLYTYKSFRQESSRLICCYEHFILFFKSHTAAFKSWQWSLKWHKLCVLLVIGGCKVKQPTVNLLHAASVLFSDPLPPPSGWLRSLHRVVRPERGSRGLQPGGLSRRNSLNQVTQKRNHLPEIKYLKNFFLNKKYLNNGFRLFHFSKRLFSAVIFLRY